MYLKKIVSLLFFLITISEISLAYEQQVNPIKQSQYPLGKSLLCAPPNGDATLADILEYRIIRFIDESGIGISVSRLEETSKITEDNYVWLYAGETDSADGYKIERYINYPRYTYDELMDKYNGNLTGSVGWYRNKGTIIYRETLKVKYYRNLQCLVGSTAEIEEQWNELFEKAIFLKEEELNAQRSKNLF